VADRDEDALAADFAARRPAALGRAYERNAALLVSVAARVLGERAAAEDCVHDALLRVWQARDSYRPERGSLRAFLATCVRNEALSRLRSSTRRAEREQRAALLEPAPVGAFEPVDPIEAARVRAALERLPADQRDVLERAYFAGLSQTEIAERTGLPLGTVKSRAALALRKLRAALQGNVS
jgi:RNA polymerase sigma-70 factor (ECF subfamily)